MLKKIHASFPDIDIYEHFFIFLFFIQHIYTEYTTEQLSNSKLIITKIMLYNSIDNVKYLNLKITL